MKRYRVAEARAKLGQLLDQVEEGQTVCVERRGTSFALVRQRTLQTRPMSEPFVEVDAELMEAGWSWRWDGKGEMALKSRPRRTRS
ncbi:MAG: type II toxin-antitoxin system Phd/YefM family antitoxin [Myxococcaceae bacterium]